VPGAVTSFFFVSTAATICAQRMLRRFFEMVAISVCSTGVARTFCQEQKKKKGK
jgi:hypothetical protein